MVSLTNRAITPFSVVPSVGHTSINLDGFSYLEELKPAISSCVPSDFIHYDDATTGYKRHQKAVDGESQHNSQGARCPVQIHMTTGFSTFCALDREKGLGTFNATIKKYRYMSIKYLMLIIFLLDIVVLQTNEEDIKADLFLKIEVDEGKIN